MSGPPRSGSLRLFCIYRAPFAPAARRYVLQEWVMITGGARPGALQAWGPSLDEVRERVPLGAEYRLARCVDDEPHLVETWL